MKKSKIAIEAPEQASNEDLEGLRATAEQYKAGCLLYDEQQEGRDEVTANITRFTLGESEPLDVVTILDIASGSTMLGTIHQIASVELFDDWQAFDQAKSLTTDDVASIMIGLIVDSEPHGYGIYKD